MPTYEVTIKAYSVTVVEAHDPLEAMEIAEQDIFSGDFEIDEKQVQALETDEEIERAKRHADRIIL